MKIALLGCGLIGERRARALGSEYQLVGVYDPNEKWAQKVAHDLNTKTFESEESLLSGSGAQIVIIATTNDQLSRLSLMAVKKKIHVLVEKPAGIRVDDLERLEKASLKNNVVVKVGFNHRFHPAILKARQLINENALGELLFLRARYGHGGRLGYEKEWRANPEVAGGGELLDQGVHLLDLIYWFLGPLPLQSSYVTTSFWKMPVEDNAVLTLKDAAKWATFHVSCSEWKNTFSMEIYGRTGKILISGLGRSYGKETLTLYKMSPQMGTPEMQTFDFSEGDQSWTLDIKNLCDHLKNRTPLLGDLKSAHYALTQIREAYRQNGFTHLPCSV